MKNAADKTTQDYIMSISKTLTGNIFSNFESYYIVVSYSEVLAWHIGLAAKSVNFYVEISKTK